MIVDVQKLSKTFQLHISQGVRVFPIKDLSFQIDEGRFLGIAGPSGAGKSTILKCIYRTYLPSAGQIWYDSRAFGRIDLAAATERQIVRLRQTEISYVSQFLKVIPRVSTLDIVMERLLSNGMPAGQAEEEAKQMLDRLRIPSNLWQAYPATFSGGEQQRVNLARAFVMRPRLLILDEPTASLDGEATAVVLEMMEELKRQGVTMIGIFHDREVLRTISDRVLDLTATEGQAGLVCV